MRLLLIETSTERGLIAYADGTNLLFSRMLPFGLNQSKFLMSLLQQMLCQNGSAVPLDGIAIGIGPGSYTGMRLGLSIAQALAYASKLPLIGVCSLNGFVTAQRDVRFAAIVDARIGGVYIRKGENVAGRVFFSTPPQLIAMDQVLEQLADITYLVTPSSKSIKAKFHNLLPDNRWLWHETEPSAHSLFEEAQKLYLEQSFVIPPTHVDLLYLRKTEAERSKEQ